MVSTRLILLLTVLWADFAQAQEPAAAKHPANVLAFQRVVVDGKPVPYRSGDELRIGPFPQTILITTGAATNSPGVPARLRFKLLGHDAGWGDRSGAEMFLAVRFFGDGRKLLDRRVFSATGDSAGWTGSLTDSPLTHRRETLTVPPGTTAWDIVVSSAGPPDTVGIYVADSLVVSELSPTNGPSRILFQTSLESLSADESGSPSPANWQRGGIQTSMAKIVELGQNPKKKALAVIDDDPRGHAEWHTRGESMKTLVPGERLVVEWNELFSIGHGVAGMPRREIPAAYENLAPGAYRFWVQEVNIFGVPTGVEVSMAVRVRSPLWETSWFWVAVATIVICASAVVSRSVASMKMRREVARLQQLRALEQERLRIARDIHDDLGARVTQISMLSAMAPDRSNFPQNVRADFDQISRMSRDLVSALYETVWAVNPENDNLYALGNHLRQVSSQLCEPAQLSCRLEIPNLPREAAVSSQIRHSISLALKEALHNVIKHARASEATVRVAFADSWLTVSIQDDGCGFQTAGQETGNGLANLKQRMEDLGGSCTIESTPGRGTTVKLRLRIEAS